jgi:catechol 2,3-dioxygenase-like lactoylglutathione lyase family enzyme
VHIDRFDHIVLTVRSIRATVQFYTTVLGMEAREFGDGRMALHFGAQKINLHESGKVIDVNVLHATPGSADICLITDVPIEQVQSHLASCGVSVITGPVARTGAIGELKSVYIRDPDENLIEIANLLA